MPLVQLSGFFAGAWLAQQSPLKILMAIRQVGRLLERGVLGAQVEQTYDLGHVREALAASVQPGRGGKILLRIAQLPE